jgi:hypothetical protein
MRKLSLLAAGSLIAAMAANTDAGAVALTEAPPKTAKPTYKPDAAPSRKVLIGRIPAFTTEGIYVRPGEHVDTVDVDPKKWQKVGVVALPGPDMAIERPPGIPQDAIPAAGGLWLVKLENGTYAALGSQPIPDASVSKEEAASELGLPLAATAGATITDPPPGEVLREANEAGPADAADAEAKRKEIEDDVNGLSVAKLKAELDAAKVSYESDANKPALQKALLDHRLKA